MFQRELRELLRMDCLEKLQFTFLFLPLHFYANVMACKMSFFSVGYFNLGFCFFSILQHLIVCQMTVEIDF